MGPLARPASGRNYRMSRIRNLAVRLAATVVLSFGAVVVGGSVAVADTICDQDGLPPEGGHPSPSRATCSDTELGEVPDVNHMVSTLVLQPDGLSEISALAP